MGVTNLSQITTGLSNRKLRGAEAGQYPEANNGRPKACNLSLPPNSTLEEGFKSRRQNYLNFSEAVRPRWSYAQRGHAADHQAQDAREKTID